MITKIEAALQTFQEDTLAQFVVPIFFLAVVIEAVWSRGTHRDLYDGRDFIASIAMADRSFKLRFPHHRY